MGNSTPTNGDLGRIEEPDDDEDESHLQNTDSGDLTQFQSDVGGELQQKPASVSEATEIPEWVTLEPDEEIIWITAPTRWTYVGILLSALVGTLFVLAVVLNGKEDIQVGPVPLDYMLLYLIPLMLAPTILAEIEGRYTKYVLTNKQLWYKSGIVTEYTNPIRLKNIETIEYDQGFVERLFSYGDIYVSTAGSTGYDMVLAETPGPASRSSDIMEYQDRES